MSKEDESLIVKGCLTGYCTSENANCRTCGNNEAEYRRRLGIPLTEDPETGLRRKVIRKERNYAET